MIKNWFFINNLGYFPKYWVYYIISGNGFLKIKDKDYKVSKDKLFFVAKDVEHCFHGNTKELKVLYFFGGPDS